MRAVDKTTQLFMASVRDAVPAAKVFVQKSRNAAGHSNYVFIARGNHLMAIKVRISDHPVGMRRAMRGDEDLYIFAGAKPLSWAVWLGELVQRMHRFETAHAILQEYRPTMEAAGPAAGLKA